MTVNGNHTTVVLDGGDEIVDAVGNSNPHPKLLTVRGEGGEPDPSEDVTGNRNQPLRVSRKSGLSSSTVRPGPPNWAYCERIMTVR